MCNKRSAFHFSAGGFVILILLKLARKAVSKSFKHLLARKILLLKTEIFMSLKIIKKSQVKRIKIKSLPIKQFPRIFYTLVNKNKFSSLILPLSSNATTPRARLTNNA